MSFSAFTPEQGLVLLGCGKMGTAMLEGWLAAGLEGRATHIVEPRPSDALKALATAKNISLTDQLERETARAVVIAVKPQMLDDATPSIAKLASPRCLMASVAAGAPIRYFEAAFGEGTPIIRTMPNTPAAVGRGVTALIANAAARDEDKDLAEKLMRAVGETVWLDHEAQMDAVTGVSGSGPAYVFHMVEALAAAGRAEGLADALAMTLARQTVIGAGALLDGSPEEASVLRENVTSPNGTTYAGLQELMADEQGLTSLMIKTVRAAAARSRELGS